MDIDLGNYQMVGTYNNYISVMNPKKDMTKDEALVHAAWLIALADPSRKRFDEIFDAIMNT